MAKRKGQAQGVVIKAGQAGTGASKATEGQPIAATGGKKKKRRQQAPEQPGSPKNVESENIDDCEESPAKPRDIPENATSKSCSTLNTSTFVASASDSMLPPSPHAAGLPATNTAASLAWVLRPMSVETFLAEYWEKKPLHIKRNQPDHYKGLFSKATLDDKVSQSPGLAYGRYINLAKFDESTGLKVDRNRGSVGTVATATEIEEEWAAGATIQAMHPQQFHEPVWHLLMGLERSFGALFGANSYLTPNGSQGLAPHFDDVEVFMLQLEGAKRWRLYEPPAGEEYPLPRDYSRDFKPDELGEPIFDGMLETGDLLYVPRGTVHQGIAVSTTTKSPCAFSHHLTVSTYQKTAWCQVLHRSLSSAVEKAASESLEFRAGLPVGFLEYMGSWNDTSSCGDALVTRRVAFQRQFKGLLQRLHEFVDLDEVCDELGVEFMASRLPPAAPSTSTSAAGSTANDSCDKQDTGEPGLTLDTKVRWVDPSAVRLMLSSDPETSEPNVLLFHSVGNQRGQHMCRSESADAEEDVGCLRYDATSFMLALRVLSDAGGKFVRCRDLPIKDEADRLALCENLHGARLLELGKA